MDIFIHLCSTSKFFALVPTTTHLEKIFWRGGVKYMLQYRVDHGDSEYQYGFSLESLSQSRNEISDNFGSRLKLKVFYSF